MNPFKKTVWSPYTVGAGIGLIAVLIFLFFRTTVGVSSVFVRVYGFLVGLFWMDHVSLNSYLSNLIEFKPTFEWQSAMIVGIIIGGFLSAKMSGQTFSFVPYLWGKRFGFSKVVRAIGAMLGGFLVLFGARLAGGCPMGCIISEGMHLSTIAWIYMPTMFATGIITAFLLYRREAFTSK